MGSAVHLYLNIFCHCKKKKAYILKVSSSKNCEIGYFLEAHFTTHFDPRSSVSSALPRDELLAVLGQ